MRKVSLAMLTPNMRLGRSVCYGSSILIREGTTDLNRFVKNLERLGIYHLYVEDCACEGIEIEDAVSDKTRTRCTKTLKETFKKLKNDFTIDHTVVTEAAESLLDEIMTHPNTLLSLNEIGNTDDSTLNHSINTAIYAVCLGLTMDYGRNDMLELTEGILLHDIGKTVLDPRILLKPQRLTVDEFEYIKTHTSLGYDLLKKSPDLSEKSKLISLNHHERLDGSGYPNGLVGDQIPVTARIAAIADVYEALTAERCYRNAVSPYHALEILTQDAAAKLDLNLTARFMQNVAVYPNGTLVQLSDGTQAIVKEQNISIPLRPVVRVIGTENGKQIPLYEINLIKSLNLTIVEPQLPDITQRPCQSSAAN